MEDAHIERHAYNKNTMSKIERITKLAEVLKNLVVVLGIPALGVYMVKYHNDQMALKDAIIELKEAQVNRAEQFSVERMNGRFIALKNLYNDQLSTVDDSLYRASVKLDSLSSVLLPFDTLEHGHWRKYGDLVIVPYDELRMATANRVVADELLRNCRAENENLKRTQALNK